MKRALAVLCSLCVLFSSAYAQTVTAPRKAKLPTAPTAPKPANRATDVITSPTLSWISNFATSYDVHFGITREPPLVSAGQTTASYTPLAPLASGTTYYWEVVAYNSAGATEGRLWSFTTEGTVWTVKAGDDLQSVLDQSAPGDTIALEAGTTFTGNFVLPAKSDSASYVTIRSSAADSMFPPHGARIDPTYAAHLPKLQSPNGSPALATAPYAHHYRIELVEFRANAQGVGDIVTLGDGSAAQSSLAVVPHDIIVDRVYIHGDAAAGQKRGLALNSASTTVEGSYISDIKSAIQDSQAICGWNGPGPYTITNNYLEATGENVLFGGADPSIPDLVPSNITFTRNHLIKQPAWMTEGWIIKNLFELKNAQDVTIDGNVMEYNWLSAQTGFAVLFTPRNQDGNAPWSVVQRVAFTNNVVRHVSSVFNILGTDNEAPSQLTNTIAIRNNLFVDVSAAVFGGDGFMLLITDGLDITLDHNTVINDGLATVYAYGKPVQAFGFTNNIIWDNAYGIMGGDTAPGNGTITAYFPNSQILKNIIVGAPPSDFPLDNNYPATTEDVGFVDYGGGNYRLAGTSSYKNTGTDGTDPGCNIDALNAAAGTAY